MRKLLTIILLTLSASAMAQHNHHHGHWQRGYSGGWNWMAPVIIGGVIGYEISRNQQPVIVQQPVIIQQPTIVHQSYCSPWTEIQNSDGTITRTRTCSQ
jgi:hypothetical protein